MDKYCIYNCDGGLIEVIPAEDSVDVMMYIEENYFSNGENYLGIKFEKKNDGEKECFLSEEVRELLE